MSDTKQAPKVHTFNTGRLYTAKGQRIAWCKLSTGNVMMVDVDRHIDYVLSVSNLVRTNADVLAAYDAIQQAPFNETEWLEAMELLPELTRAAGAL